jgi:hypothetical protein
MVGGRSPGRTFGPLVAGVVGLAETLAVGDMTGPEAIDDLDGGWATPLPPHATATNVTTTSRPATPIRMGKSCLTPLTPRPRYDESVDNS